MTPEKPIPQAAQIFKDLPQQAATISPRTDDKDYDEFLSDENMERRHEQGLVKAQTNLLKGAAGLPGNVVSAVNQLTGGHIPQIKAMSRVLPSTETLSEYENKLFGDYTKPQGEFDETAMEFMQDVGSMLALPGVGSAAGTGGKLINAARKWQPVLTPLLGATIKESAKSMGAEKDNAGLLKIGSMILADVLINRGKGSQAYVNDLFKKSDAALQGAAKTNVNSLRSSLLNTKSQLSLGGKSPDKTKALEKIEEILGSMTRKGKNYEMDVKEFPAFRKSINSVRETLGGWNPEFPKGVRKRAIRNLEDVKKQIIDTGMDYGKKHNPEFAKYWSAANEASNINSRTNVATKFIKEYLGSKKFAKILGGSAVAHGVTHGLAGKSVFASLAKTAAVGVPATAIGTAAYGTAKVVTRMVRSPTMRKYYGNLFKAALNKDGPLVAKYAAKIEKQSEKEQTEEEDLIGSILKD